MYHRFGEDRYPSTSVTLAQFEAQIEHLASGGYTVLPVPEIIAALDSGRPLPERTDGHHRGRRDAVDLRRGLAPAGRGGLSVDRLRLHRCGRPRPCRHHELGRAPPARRGRGDHRQSQRRPRPHVARRFGRETGPTCCARNGGSRRSSAWMPRSSPTPTANGTERYARSWRSSASAAAFGQHSGVVATHTDRFNLPRYALNESYGAIDRFTLIADTLPLGARAVTAGGPDPGGEPAGNRLHRRAAAREPRLPRLLCLRRRHRHARAPGRRPGGRAVRRTLPARPRPAQLHRARRGRALALVRASVRRAAIAGRRRWRRAAAPIRWARSLLWADQRRPLTVVQPGPVEIAQPVLAHDRANAVHIGRPPLRILAQLHRQGRIRQTAGRRLRSRARRSRKSS